MDNSIFIPELRALVDTLYNNWFTIITKTYESFKDEEKTYFYVSKDDRIAYIDCDRYKYNVTTVNVPSGNHGTGTQVYSDWTPPTINSIYRAMNNPQFRDRETQPQYYPSLQAFINSNKSSALIETFSK